MNIKDYKNIFMSGIGGISMSGIAEILVKWGFEVSGSDSTPSEIVDRLRNKGINVIIGQTENNISENIDLYIYSAAIKEDNPERIAVQKLGIPAVERGEFLGELTKLFKTTIGVSGTHGKTTTSSMIACCFLADNKDPSIQIGSLLKQIDGNYRVGNSDYFIIEACEYNNSFLNFKQHSALVTNIDNDHLDFFGSLNNIIKSFKEYVGHLPEDGYLIINKDDDNAMKIVNETRAEVITYSITEEADVYAKDIIINEDGCGQFNLYQHDNLLGPIRLSVPGIHNVSNAVGAIAISLCYGVAFESIQRGLEDYKGASRRLEYKGIFNGAKVYDDYGHHPTEINATIDAIHQTHYNKSWVIFEPHTYSRTYEHKKNFATSLAKFDNIIIIDIYAAREKNESGITEADLVSAIKEINPNVVHISDYDAIINYLSTRVGDNDIILTLGAGYVTKISDLLASRG